MKHPLHMSLTIAVPLHVMDHSAGDKNPVTSDRCLAHVPAI